MWQAGTHKRFTYSKTKQFIKAEVNTSEQWGVEISDVNNASNAWMCDMCAVELLQC